MQEASHTPSTCHKSGPCQKHVPQPVGQQTQASDANTFNANTESCSRQAGRCLMHVSKTRAMAYPRPAASAAACWAAAAAASSRSPGYCSCCLSCFALSPTVMHLLGDTSSCSRGLFTPCPGVSGAAAGCALPSLCSLAVPLGKRLVPAAAGAPEVGYLPGGWLAMAVAAAGAAAEARPLVGSLALLITVWPPAADARLSGPTLFLMPWSAGLPAPGLAAAGTRLPTLAPRSCCWLVEAAALEGPASLHSLPPRSPAQGPAAAAGPAPMPCIKPCGTAAAPSGLRRCLL